MISGKAKVVGLILAVVGAGIFVIVAMVSADRAQLARSQITNELLKNGSYDPAQHFTFTKACVYRDITAPLDRLKEGYREVDAVSLDASNLWTLTLFNEPERTFVRLYISDPPISPASDIFCSHRLVISTAVRSGSVVATISEK